MHEISCCLVEGHWSQHSMNSTICSGCSLKSAASLPWWSWEPLHCQAAQCVQCWVMMVGLVLSWDIKRKRWERTCTLESKEKRKDLFPPLHFYWHLCWCNPSFWGLHLHLVKASRPPPLVWNVPMRRWGLMASSPLEHRKGWKAAVPADRAHPCTVQAAKPWLQGFGLGRAPSCSEHPEQDVFMNTYLPFISMFSRDPNLLQRS